MSLRQRHPPQPSSSTPTQPPSTSTEVSLPWYQYPLNLILARTLRYLGKFGFYLHNKRYKPNGIPVTRTTTVRMRDGHSIILHIYEPSLSSSSQFQQATPSSSSRSELRPCVINFHGGGFTIGSGTDDSRWAFWCTRIRTRMSEASGTGNSSGASRTNDTNEVRSNTTTRDGDERGLGAIFISIEYRLAPEYPHPTPVNDCIDSTLHILKNAKEYGIDVGKVFLSGFSAGGSLAVTTALALTSSSPLDSSYTSASTSTRATTSTSKPNPIAGVIAFYPVLDFHTPRYIKRSNALAYADSQGGSKKIIPLPGWMTRMFDTSYLPPHLSLDRMDPMISPGLAPDLGGFPHVHLILCGADVLAHEGREFGERSRSEGREVVVRTVPGARHGWDKPPLPLQGSVSEEYDAAIQSLLRWCQ